MSRIFVSHSSRDNRQALALKQWLGEQRPELATEIFLDIDPETGLRAGTRWKDALRRANHRCEAVICVLSRNWESSHECKTEYRTAENLGKQILVARLEKMADSDITGEWQRCDLFAEGPQTEIPLPGDAPVQFNTEALRMLRKALEGSGIGPENFAWPPSDDPRRAPYRGWEPFEDIDAAVFFGRDAAIMRGMDELRTMRRSGVKSLFVVLGPSGSGKSSFLRAGLIPRLQRDDHHFLTLGVMRPERNALTGEHGFAAAIHTARTELQLGGAPLGEIKDACLAGPDGIVELLAEVRAAAAQRLVDAAQPGATPTLVLPLDQAEELFSADAGPQAEQFLGLLTQLVSRINVDEVGLLVAATIRTDRYEVMQNHPALAGVGSVLFDELKPMPATQFKEVITGPAARSSAGGHRLTIAPDLVNRLLADAAEGADTLPLLALTLARLYADYASSGELTLANYEAMGGMRRVVQNAIDEVLAANPGPRDRQLQLLRSAFVPWLATINPDNDQPLRRVAHYNDLPAASRPLIDALVEKRLLIRDERDGKVVIEVALESLLRQWDELAGWLREERQHLKSADDIERNATAWATRGHDPAWLLTGTRLSDAETLSATPGFRSRLAGTRGYLAASRNTEDRKREAEEQHRQAELRHAEEVARLAQESQRLAQERQQAAEAHTVDLRKRARLLRAVLAATVVIAVAAAFGFVQTWYAKRDVQQKYLESTALRLATDSSGILAGDRPGNDIRAFQELLAAQAIDPKYDAALLDAQAKRFSTVKILNAGGKISMSALSPDGHLFAATSGDKLQLWDVDAGRPVGDAVPGENGVAFSPDGKLVATGGSNNTVLVYGVDKRDLKQTLSGPGRVMARIAFSRDGQTLAAASLDGTVWLWNPNTGQAIRTLRPDSHKGVVAVAFSPDGAHLATGGADRQVLVWETSTGRLERSIPGHDGEVTGLAYDFDGKVLASVGHDRKIKFWDDTGKSIRDPLTTDDAVMDVAFDPQPTLRLASTGSSGTVNLWNFDHGEVIQSALPGHAGQSQALTFSANGGRLAVGSEDGLIRVWNPDRGEPMTASIGGVNGVAYSQDGTRIVSASGDGSLQLWDPNTGQADGDAMPGGADGLMSVAISPDARTVVAGDGAGNVQVWNPNTRKLIRKLTGHQGNVNSVAFSPDGNLIASGGEDGLIMIWNAETGQTRTLTGHDGYVNALTFSHDGHRIISGGTDSKAIVWNVDTGDRVVTIDNGAYVDGLALSPDGHDLVTGGADALIRRWNADTGASLGAQMVGHGNAVPAIAYSPDGRQIISGSYDKTVRLWDAKTGKPIGTPMTGHTNFITSLAVSPNGQLVVSGSQDYTLRLWPITASVSDLCAKLTTNMSQKHWREWVAPDIRYRTACPGLPIAPD